MELTMLDVYLFIALDSVIATFAIIFVVSLVYGIICVKEAMDNTWDEDDWVTPPAAIKAFTVCAVVALLGTFTPSTKQGIAIYLIPKIANNRDVQAIPVDSLKLLRAYISKNLEEVAPVLDALEELASSVPDSK